MTFRAGQWQVGIEYGEGYKLPAANRHAAPGRCVGGCRACGGGFPSNGAADAGRGPGATERRSDPELAIAALCGHRPVGRRAVDGGRAEEAHSDTAVDVPEEPVTVPFRFGIAEFRDRALELVFHVETGDEQGWRK